MRPIKTYWIDCDNNWGDVCSKHILKRLYNFELEKVSPEKAELFCTGSILLKMPMEYTGHVLGTGAWDWKPGRASFDAQNVHMWLVRGHLTREHYNCNEEPLIGDPGILAHLWADPTIQKQYDIGVIPHYVDRYQPEVVAAEKKGYHIINVQAGFQEVINEASKCRKIVSSSLHGLILCDSIGVPNQWVGWDWRVVDRGHDTFKFNDYYSVYGEKAHVYDKIQDALPHCRTRDTTQVKIDVKLAFDRYAEFIRRGEE